MAREATRCGIILDDLFRTTAATTQTDPVSRAGRRNGGYGCWTWSLRKAYHLAAAAVRWRDARCMFLHAVDEHRKRRLSQRFTLMCTDRGLPIARTLLHEHRVLWSNFSRGGSRCLLDEGCFRYMFSPRFHLTGISCTSATTLVLPHPFGLYRCILGTLDKLRDWSNLEGREVLTKNTSAQCN